MVGMMPIKAYPVRASSWIENNKHAVLKNGIIYVSQETFESMLKASKGEGDLEEIVREIHLLNLDKCENNYHAN